MIFIIDNQGTTKAVVLQEPIYQGSNNANRIILLAPIPSTNVPSASFMIPNGMTTQPYVMTYFAGEMGEDKNLNGWYLDVDYAITQYAGVVNIQFSIGTPQGTLKTYTSSFEVQQGILTLPPDQSVSGRNLYEEVLNQLAVVQGNMGSLRSEVTIIGGEVTTLKSNIENAQSDIDNINNQIPNKVDKMPAHDTEHAYISIGGQDTSMPISHQIVPNSIVARDENGNTSFPYPNNYNDPVTKGYADNLKIKSFKYEMSKNDYEINLYITTEDGTKIYCDPIDLPLESIVIGGEYDAATKKLILQLKSNDEGDSLGNTIEIDISDIVSGLVNREEFDLLEERFDNHQMTYESRVSALNKEVGGLKNKVTDVETNKQDKAVERELVNSDGTEPLIPNSIYKSTAPITDLNIDFSEGMYHLIFTVGTDFAYYFGYDAVNVAGKDTVTFINSEPQFNEGETWEINILDGIGVAGKVVL